MVFFPHMHMTTSNQEGFAAALFWTPFTLLFNVPEICCFDGFTKRYLGTSPNTHKTGGHLLRLGIHGDKAFVVVGKGPMSLPKNVFGDFAQKEHHFINDGGANDHTGPRGELS